MGEKLVSLILFDSNICEIPINPSLIEMKLKEKGFTNQAGFTVLELMVAVAVTALLAAILQMSQLRFLILNGWPQLTSKPIRSLNLYSIKYRKIYNVLFIETMAMFGWQSIYLIQKENSGEWDFADDGNPDKGKPLDESLRLIRADWPKMKIIARR